MTRSRHQTAWTGVDNCVRWATQRGWLAVQRREFIALIGGMFGSWPSTGRAQQVNQARRIGILMNRAEDDAEGQAGVAAFRQALQQLGWSDLSFDVRWGQDDVALERRYAEDLVKLSPAIIARRLLTPA